MTDGTGAAPAKTPERQGLLSMLVNIFVDPKSTFEQVAIAPRWWLPLALVVLATIGYMTVFSIHVGWDNYIQRLADTNERMQEMPADQRAQAIEMQRKMVPVMGMIGPPVFIPLSMAVIAAVLMFVFRMLLDANVRFPQTFAVVTWSSIPGLLGTAAALAVMLLKRPDEFDLENPVGFNIGFYLPEGTSRWIVSLGNSIDLFSIWTILLIATGMSVIGRKPWGTALGGVLLPWTLYVLCKIGWVAMFS